MTMHAFYQQLVSAQRQPAVSQAPLARLMHAGLAHVRQVQSALGWVAW